MMEIRRASPYSLSSWGTLAAGNFLQHSVNALAENTQSHARIVLFFIFAVTWSNNKNQQSYTICTKFWRKLRSATSLAKWTAYLPLIYPITGIEVFSCYFWWHMIFFNFFIDFVGTGLNVGNQQSNAIYTKFLGKFCWEIQLPLLDEQSICL